MTKDNFKKKKKTHKRFQVKRKDPVGENFGKGPTRHSALVGTQHSMFD